MALLITQLSVFLLFLLVLKVKYHGWYYYRAASVAMGAMLVMAAAGHFMYAEGMQLMLPAWVPFKKPIVLLTGIYELMLAYSFFLPHRRKIAARICMVYLALTLPVNIYASIYYVNYVQADYSGDGPVYLWFRIPLQLFWIAWCYFIYRWNPLPLKKIENGQ
ncbi:DoxX family protein [Gynurincola endophyticus]|uniref:DoxX family protein n=1 Tax=Gynurincola endophyticus TaxID=2479004 RepID=UPI000F8CACF4|nr:hypothetical protein [Gynurincola endophyticus]